MAKMYIDQVIEKIEYWQTVKRMFEKYPNMEVKTDRWENERFFCKDFNQKANSVEFRSTCGCCPDAVVEAYPYCVTEEFKGIKIYTNPLSIQIGEGNVCGTGIIEYENWESKLSEHNIHPDISKLIREYLNDNPVEYYSYDEDGDVIDEEDGEEDFDY